MLSLKFDPNSLVPLPENVWNILMALGSGKPMHGYRINQVLKEEITGSKLGAATLYRTLGDMLEKGLIEEVSPPPDEASTDERRRYYQVSGKGKEVVRAQKAYNKNQNRQADSQPAYAN